MKDNVVVSDGNNTVVVNLQSYCELLKWLIVEYIGVSYDEASIGIEKHRDYFEDFDMSIISVSLESHDWPYYFAAMSLYFGDYHKAISIIIPPCTSEGTELYREIEKRILNEHGLNEPFEWR